MVRRSLLGLAAAMLAGPAVAQGPAVPLNFQRNLLGIQDTIRKQTAEVREELGAQSESALNRLTWDARDLERESRDLKWQVQRVARRARTAGRERGQDPFLRNEVRQLVWDLQRHLRDAQRLGRDAERLNREAPRDRKLLSAAETAERAVSQWLNEAGWLTSEGRFAGMDLRRAGFSMEAWDVERHSREAEDEARGAERALNALIQALRSAPEGEG